MPSIQHRITFIKNRTLLKTIFSKYFGPSTLVTAAFIGPGTLTICTLAGVGAGYALLWALLFSVLATIILQEMTARLGLVTQDGLGEAIRKELTNPTTRIIGVLLILSAIVIGNAAYEAGNISGAMLGLNGLISEASVDVGGFQLNIWPILVFIISFWLLYSGSYKRIERFLIALVVIMSIVFLTTAIVVQPSLSAIFTGLFVPSLSGDDIFLVIGLIGTTVVPYNLFLHASSVREKWTSTDELSDLRKENMVAIGLGGIISMSIVITSAAAFANSDSGVNNIADMATQLEPLLGKWSTLFLGMGMFAAGISSSITAPLAAAYAANGVLGWGLGLKDLKFRFVWFVVLSLGAIFSVVGYSPIEVIRFAQVANGVLLPVIAIFLLYIMNRSELLGSFKNSKLQNVLGLIVIAVSLLISFRTLNSIFHFV